MKKNRLLLMLLVLPLLPACGSPVYRIASIDAVVVDAHSGLPIEGVIVVANWELVRGGLDGPRIAGQLEVKEAVTDKDGRFHIDGFVRANPWLKELRDSDPRLLFFKPGFQIQRFSNTYPNAGTETPGPLRKSQLNGGTVRMVKASDVEADNQRRFYYPAFNFDLEEVVRSDCDWKKIPRMLLASDAEKRRLKGLHPTASVDLLEIQQVETMSNPGCGSAANFFKNYKP